MFLFLTACTPTIVEGHWIKTAEKVCSTHGGLYSISYTTNNAFKMVARCEDGDIKELSQ